MGKLYDPYAEFEHVVLPNGLSVYVLHRLDHPWVAAGLVVHAGGKEDQPGLEGTAHFVEHLVSSNVVGVKMDELKKFFESYGGGVNLGRTFLGATTYDFFLPSEEEAVKKGFDLLGQMVFGPRLNERIEEQRRIILQEYRQSFPYDWEFNWKKKITETLYPTLFMSGRPSTLGRPQTINSIMAEDLNQFYDYWYTPTNTTLVVVGGLSSLELEKILNGGALGRSKFGQRNQPLGPLKHVPQPLVPKLELHENDFRLEPTDNLSYTIHSLIPGEYRQELVELVASILRELVFKVLREEKNWSYSAGAGSESASSFSVIYCYGDKMSLSAQDSVHELMVEIVSSLPDHSDLFHEYRRNRIRSLSIQDKNDSQIRDCALDDIRVYQRIIPISEMIDSLEEFTVDDLCDICRYLDPTRYLVTVRLP